MYAQEKSSSEEKNDYYFKNVTTKPFVQIPNTQVFKN